MVNQVLKQTAAIVKKVPTPVWYVLGAGLTFAVAKNKITEAFQSVKGWVDKSSDTRQIKSVSTTDKSRRMSITNVEAQSIADILLGAMNRFGTSYDDMIKALAPLNGEDLKAVYNKFGKHHYDKYNGVKTWEWLGDERDLFGWFQGELDEEEDAKMRQIWAKSGLIYGRSSSLSGVTPRNLLA